MATLAVILGIINLLLFVALYLLVSAQGCLLGTIDDIVNQSIYGADGTNARVFRLRAEMRAIAGWAKEKQSELHNALRNVRLCKEEQNETP